MAYTEPYPGGKKPPKTKDKVWPTESVVLSGYDYAGDHHAIDIGIRNNANIFSPVAGEVVWTGYDEDGYGNLVIVKDAEGNKHYLAHLNEIDTAIGDAVIAGQVVGLGGSTGNSSGPHLHYEIRTAGGGGYINPWDFFGTTDPTGGSQTAPPSQPGVDYSPSNPAIPHTQPTTPGIPSATPNIPDDKTGSNAGLEKDKPEITIINPLTGEPAGYVQLPSFPEIPDWMQSPGNAIKGFFDNVSWSNVGAIGVGLVILFIAIYALAQKSIVQPAMVTAVKAGKAVL